MPALVPCCFEACNKQKAVSLASKRNDPSSAVVAAAYHTAELKCRRLLRDYEIKKEQKIIECNNAGSFYRFVNKKLSCRRGLGALHNNMGDVIVSDAERADLLNSYFSSVCTTDNGIMPIFERSVPDNVVIDSVEYTPGKVRAAIKKLKAGGSCGPDGYPPMLFKRTADCIAEPLSLMFTSLMSVSKIPMEWSHSIVTPVYKNGAASNVSNYRPISLTCVACRIMERVIAYDVLNYLRRHGVTSKQQHGFLSGRSTTSDLLEAFNDWTLALNDKNSVAVANIDFAKAFDTVSHSKLLCKLQSHGISGRLLCWISSFLSGRTQQTRVGSSLAAITSLTSGVIQGSVIGPLLFVLFINDITLLFNSNKCTCKLYADDLKLYSVLHAEIDCNNLQDHLNAVYDWSQKWQLNISYKKCNLMYIGNTHYKPNLLLNNDKLAVVDTVKDLGVAIDYRLTFDVHVRQIVARANLIHKCFVSRDIFTLMRSFRTHVRPLIEYASCVQFRIK